MVCVNFEARNLRLCRYTELVVDDLSVRAFIGSVQQEGIFPHEHTLAVRTHTHFAIEYNGENVRV
jgi:hypothetical protein